MSHLGPLLERNRAFAATEARRELATMMRPRQPVLMITCLDPRVEPAAVLGVGLGDALVVRNAGGRVTRAVIEDVAFISFMGEQMNPVGPLFEVAVIHHTRCGTAALANEEFRAAFAQRTRFDDAELAREAVLDPAATVRADVERLLSAPEVSPRITVSGHVYDLETGLVSTIIAPVAPQHARTGVAA
jgi:carbonic anhydrase